MYEWKVTFFRGEGNEKDVAKMITIETINLSEAVDIAKSKIQSDYTAFLISDAACFH